MIESLIASFTLALISEIADKTQLVIFGLALKYKAPFKVFLGALLAHAFMDGIAISLGTLFAFSLSAIPIKRVTGALFILLGIWEFVKLRVKKPKKKEKAVLSRLPFTASFLTVLFSEFGDKTQIASGLLAVKYSTPLPIFIGFVLALGIAIGFNVFIGSKLAKKLPEKIIRIVVSVSFILFGIFALLFR